MAYRLSYSDYVTAEGPPDPAEWVGPPGPVGPAGPKGEKGDPGSLDEGGTVTGPLIYTATGGTTPRSAQDRAGGYLTVEDFGAVGDGTTDDSAAFNAFAAYVRAATGYQAQRTLILSANRTYLVSNPINFNQLQPYRVTIEGNGSAIVGNVGSTKTIISAMASIIVFRNLRIFSQGLVKTGIQIGIASTAPADDQPCHMDSVHIVGTFANAPLYNRGAECSSFANCMFINQQANGYAAIMDGCAHWAIDTTTIADTFPTDGSLSFNAQTFTNTQFRTTSTTANSPAIWMGGQANRHNYVASYAYVNSESPIAVYHSQFSNAGVGLNGLTWDVHGEVLPSCQFFITGPFASPVIEDLVFQDHYNQVRTGGTVFKLDTTITTCKLRNLDYRAPYHYQSGVVLFDQPAKYTVTGRVEVPTAAAFNSPASFSGDLLTADAVDTTANSLRVTGTSGFNNTAPIAKPTVTGAKGSNAALASLITALAAYGLVTDSTGA